MEALIHVLTLAGLVLVILAAAFVAWMVFFGLIVERFGPIDYDSPYALEEIERRELRAARQKGHP